jgi:hypothetical protein
MFHDTNKVNNILLCENNCHEQLVDPKKIVCSLMSLIA